MLHYEYKLRFYELSGSNKGNLRTEEFFASREGLLNAVMQTLSGCGRSVPVRRGRSGSE